MRKRFCGKPEFVENFMRFIAQDFRGEWMAKIGVKTVDEMIGHVEDSAKRLFRVTGSKRSRFVITIVSTENLFKRL